MNKMILTDKTPLPPMTYGQLLNFLDYCSGEGIQFVNVDKFGKREVNRLQLDRAFINFFFHNEPRDESP